MAGTQFDYVVLLFLSAEEHEDFEAKERHGVERKIEIHNKRGR